MLKFDSDVQLYKYKVLKEVARLAYKGTLADELDNIPDNIFPDDYNASFIDIYKQRSIVKDKIRLATGGNIHLKNVVEVIDKACAECPRDGFEITSSCRGCLAHRCAGACKFGAISFGSDGHAHIDITKCKSCGACSRECPYSAIRQNIRPCKLACKVNAMGYDEKNAAKIDDSKCINCGACSYQCPFGAIVDKSYILDIIDYIKESDNNKNYKVYAVVAPAIASQFDDAKLAQVITGIKKLGFHTVIEAAFGADMVTENETKELIERKFLTSSCCPAFVKFIKLHFDDILKDISDTPSPMVACAKFIKEMDKTAKVVFIGPCIAKKAEVKYTDAKKFVDAVMTFEELRAMFGAKEIDLSSLEETPLDNASYYGRIFARSGGLTDAVKECLKELNVTDFYPKIETCDGIEQCNVALLKKTKGILDANFIEGMACVNGCIGGAGCITHAPKNKADVDKYGKEAFEKKILDVTKLSKSFDK